MTREFSRPLDEVLDPLVMAAMYANASLWQFALRDGGGAWMQTYDEGGAYPLHVDAAPGQSRKLTAVLLLSEPESYLGGDLTVQVTPKDFRVARARGTVVVFPAWVPHYVTPVTQGVRKTINLGFWGPPFR